MEIDEIKVKFDSWEGLLSRRQKKYIHFRSIQNFVFYYEYLADIVKQKVASLFASYITEVEENLFDYKGEKSYQLAINYVDTISKYYIAALGFKPFMKLQTVVIFSILGDGILYLFLRNRVSFYFPIISLVLFIHYFYTRFYYERKRKVFGLFY